MITIDTGAASSKAQARRTDALFIAGSAPYSPARSDPIFQENPSVTLANRCGAATNRAYQIGLRRGVDFIQSAALLVEA
jgi:hypothetical protein